MLAYLPLNRNATKRPSARQTSGRRLETLLTRLAKLKKRLRLLQSKFRLSMLSSVRAVKSSQIYGRATSKQTLPWQTPKPIRIARGAYGNLNLLLVSKKRKPAGSASTPAQPLDASYRFMIRDARLAGSV
jgi:hypothetical protein